MPGALSPKNLKSTLTQPVGTLTRFIPKQIRLLNKPGLPPGTIQTREDAHPTKIFLYEYSEEKIEERELKNLDNLQELLTNQNMVWLNIIGMANVDLIKQISNIAEIHPLALEDAFEIGQLPKVDVYQRTFLILAQMIHVQNQRSLEQVSFFMGNKFLITIQEHEGDVFDDVRERLRVGRGRIRKEGPDYLLYALLDTLVDHYFILIDNVEKEILELEDRIIFKADDKVFKDIHFLRGQVRQIRRLFRPHRLAIESLTKPHEEESDITVSDTARTYMRDCYDHACMISDSLENLSDQLSDLMDLYHSVVSTRMNEIMKVLTIVAAIFIPLTFVAGIYGMNFNPEASSFNMPELNHPFGYPAALITMVIIAVGMFIFFRYKRWL